MQRMTPSEKRKQYNEQYRAENKTRFHRVSVTLSPEEYKQLQAWAKTDGKKPTTTLKNSAFAYKTQTFIMPEIVKDELQALRFLLLNAVNNINQIAHHSNTIQRLIDENALLLEIQKMEETINIFVSERMKP